MTLEEAFVSERLEFQIPAGSRSLFPHSQTAEMGRGLVLNRPHWPVFNRPPIFEHGEYLPVVAFNV